MKPYLLQVLVGTILWNVIVAVFAPRFYAKAIAEGDTRKAGFWALVYAPR
jgi:hypothetical protein